MKRMTPRQRVLAVLRGEKIDKVPFTVYENLLPRCDVERELRNRGLCIIQRKVNVFKSEYPNCRMSRSLFSKDGKKYFRDLVKTPVGEVQALYLKTPTTNWVVERLFKGPGDYKILQFMVKDEVIKPDYETFLKAEELSGEDVLHRAGAGPHPLHMIMDEWMGIETFAIEWMDRRDEIEALEKIMASRLEERFRIIADSPATHANFGGNEMPDIMGPHRYRQYCLPRFKQCAGIFNEKGKFLGSHMDGNNAPWKDQLAESGLHYIEAFTPAPDTDMSLEEAFKAWPDKVMWINFPSSIHLADEKRVREVTRELLKAARNRRMIMGITEDVPPDRWKENFLIIADEIEKSV